MRYYEAKKKLVARIYVCVECIRLIRKFVSPLQRTEYKWKARGHWTFCSSIYSTHTWMKMLECFPLRMAFSKSSCNGVIQSCTLKKGENLIVGEGVVICSPAAGYTNLSPLTRPNPINMTKARNILLLPRKQRKRINTDKQTFCFFFLTLSSSLLQ